ncbi:MAG TPA: tyrosine--tRNA ligase [Candidatus Dojkabacteria bacterium]|jgi:tyrosyl-tRNA synthetase|nr:tyrosine--tRNA ligase [Candidatus Dojkabacteria bacterium]
MEIKKDLEIIERILNKAVEQILPSKDALKEKLLSGKRLTIYQGFDPTAPTLHIGHTVGMRKLEDFRKLGHKVIFLIGDFTARIGDPSDKKDARASARKVLTKEQIAHNLKNYVEQASHIIDIDNKENPVEIKYNSEWLDKLTFAEIIGLASEFTVQQMLKRSMFQERLKEDRPIYLNEFLYPLMQGYDSVMMEVDVEVGGNDQLFNMLAGRDMVFNHLNKEKIVIAGKLLEATGGEKMGKSEGNMVRLDDSAKDIYGKIMSFEDEKILIGFEILTNATLPELDEYKKRLESGENPMILKKELAYRITKEIKSKEEAENAQKVFESVFQKKDVEGEIPTTFVKENKLPLNNLLVEIGFAKSKSDARRLVDQGAVKINEEKKTTYNEEINITNTPQTIKVGKHITNISIQK